MWLKYDRRLFWLTGKPGSGKSTLMKHLVDSSTTRQLLCLKRRYKANILYFFLHSTIGEASRNAERQMLLSWLIRLEVITSATFFQDLDVPQLLDQVVDRMTKETTRWCIFVDGVDEYTGDCSYFINLLLQLQDRTNAKLCLSSREHAEINETLSMQQVTRLVMNHHNSNSINHYLWSANRRAAVKLQKPCPEPLLERIAQQAQGVTLWAKLAPEDVLQGCAMQETTAMLEKRLSNLPARVEALYETSLSRVPIAYRIEAYIYLKVMHAFGYAFVQDFRDVLNLDGFVHMEWWTGYMTSLQSLNKAQFETRVRALLGALVECEHRLNYSTPRLRPTAIEALPILLNVKTFFPLRALYDRLFNRNKTFNLVHQTLAMYLQSPAFSPVSFLHECQIPTKRNTAENTTIESDGSPLDYLVSIVLPAVISHAQRVRYQGRSIGQHRGEEAIQKLCTLLLYFYSFLYMKWLYYSVKSAVSEPHYQQPVVETTMFGVALPLGIAFLFLLPAYYKHKSRIGYSSQCEIRVLYWQSPGATNRHRSSTPSARRNLAVKTRPGPILGSSDKRTNTW